MERLRQEFIPNDVALGGKLPNLVLLTGANMVRLCVDQSNRIGREVDSIETNLYCCDNGTSRMLSSWSKGANDPCRSHHVSFRSK